MDKPATLYTKDKARTISGIRQCTTKPVHQRFGVKHIPLLNIELHHVVPDELHLLLRITDVLECNVIKQVLEQDIKARSDQCKQALLRSIRKCGVSFRIWESKEAGKRGCGNFDWTSLTGSEKKILLRKLPTYFSQFLPKEHVDSTKKIWNVSVHIWQCSIHNQL